MKIQPNKKQRTIFCWRALPIVCLFLLSLASCSIEKRIAKKYAGCNLWDVKKEFGTPRSIMNLKNGQQLVIFEQIKHLNAAKVNTQAFQYDELTSPAVEKKERYLFYVDQSGKVIDFKFERIYER